MGLMRYTFGSVAVLVLVAGEVFAVDPIQLNPLVSSFYTGGDSSVMTWDRTNAAYAVNSPFFTLSSTNTASSPVLAMLGWGVDLQFVPQSGATGSLHIIPDYTKLSFPSPQALTGNDIYYVQAGYSTTYANNPNIQFGDYDWVGSTDFIAYSPTIGTGNLVRFGLTASDNANGTFLVRAVGNPSNTSWSSELGENPFSNVPNSGVLNLGTVIVTAPEPSLVAMGVGGGLIGLGFYVRRRRQQKVAAED